MSRPARSLATAAALTGALAAALALPACRPDLDHESEARALTQGGEPARGRALIQHYGCGSCHHVPGVPGARGSVGPSLATVRRRSYVAGVLQHTPENLVRWIESPRRVDSLTAMPELGVSPRDARDIAAYLYTIDQ